MHLFSLKDLNLGSINYYSCSMSNQSRFDFSLKTIDKLSYSFYIPNQNFLHQLLRPAPNSPSASITSREVVTQKCHKFLISRSNFRHNSKSSPSKRDACDRTTSIRRHKNNEAQLSRWEEESPPPKSEMYARAEKAKPSKAKSETEKRFFLLQPHFTI